MNEKAKHTPGPWVAEPTVPSEGFDCWHIASPSGDIAWSKGYQDEPEKQANAALIAAAPDLLALCCEMVDCLDPKMVEAHDSGGLAALGITHSETGCSLCKARAIIAKARGQ